MYLPSPVAAELDRCVGPSGRVAMRKLDNFSALLAGLIRAIELLRGSALL